MSLHFERDMENLRREVLSLSANVERMVAQATLALMERNWDVARAVIASDPAIDRQEILIEEECLKMLALHQPVAVDLRRIVTTIKVNNELERIADLAVNVAQRAQSLIGRPDFPIPAGVETMVKLATAMVHKALDALVEVDIEEARAVCLQDDEVDELNREVIEELQERMRNDGEYVEVALHCFSAARQLERIADHATNIAEDVVYLVEGEIARHHAAEFFKPKSKPASA